MAARASPQGDTTKQAKQQQGEGKLRASADSGAASSSSNTGEQVKNEALRKQRSGKKERRRHDMKRTWNMDMNGALYRYATTTD
eukprot:scaffold10050_cov143-Isochrysis_galbana.AAC.4